jgi:hypothetical protein
VSPPEEVRVSHTRFAYLSAHQGRGKTRGRGAPESKGFEAHLTIGESVVGSDDGSSRR